MDVSMLRQILALTPEKVLIVDVRERDEVIETLLFGRGVSGYACFPLSVLSVVPKEEVQARLEECATEAGRVLDGTTIVVVCRSGNRSARAQGLLREAGIFAENLDGGLLSWKKKKRGRALTAFDGIFVS